MLPCCLREHLRRQRDCSARLRPGSPEQPCGNLAPAHERPNLPQPGLRPTASAISSPCSLAEGSPRRFLHTPQNRFEFVQFVDAEPVIELRRWDASAERLKGIQDGGSLVGRRWCSMSAGTKVCELDHRKCIVGVPVSQRQLAHKPRIHEFRMNDGRYERVQMEVEEHDGIRFAVPPPAEESHVTFQHESLGSVRLPRKPNLQRNNFRSVLIWTVMRHSEGML